MKRSLIGVAVALAAGVPLACFPVESNTGIDLYSRRVTASNVDQELPQTTTALPYVWEPIPGATSTVTVPEGHVALLTATLEMGAKETCCMPGLYRTLLDGVPMEPYEEPITAAGPPEVNAGNSSRWNSERVATVSAGIHELQVEYAHGSPDPIKLSYFVLTTTATENQP